MTAIPSNIDNQIKLLDNKNAEELFDIIGAYSLSQQPDVLRSSLAADGMLDKDKIRKAGKQFLSDITPIIRETICGQYGVADLVEDVTVNDILTIVLPILGMSTVGMVPTAIIAVCLVIIRIGIREYCENNMTFWDGISCD